MSNANDKPWTEGEMAKLTQSKGWKTFRVRSPAEDLVTFARLESEGRGVIFVEVLCTCDACAEDPVIWRSERANRPEQSKLACVCVDHDPDWKGTEDQLSFVVSKKWIDELHIPDEAEILATLLQALVGITLGPRGMTAKNRAWHQLERLKASRDPDGAPVVPEEQDPAEDPAEPEESDDEDAPDA